MITALYKSTYLLTYLVMPGLIYLNSIAGSKPMEYNDKKPSNIYIKQTKILIRQLLKSGDSMLMSDSKKPAQDYYHSS